jgi:hypothetical protein
VRCQVGGERPVSWAAGRGLPLLVGAAGYTPGTVRNMLNDLGQVGQWMSSVGLEAAQLDEDVMVAFLDARHAAGHRKVPGARAMVPLLSYLREAGLAPAVQPPQTPFGTLLGRYRSWLVEDRGPLHVPARCRAEQPNRSASARAVGARSAKQDWTVYGRTLLPAP